jgi:hypothetical protein
MMRSTVLRTGLEKVWPSRFFQVMAIAIIVLLLTVATAFGGETHKASRSETEVDKEQPVEEVEHEVSADDEGVTMAFDLEEGGVIDLEMKRGDVVVDTWDGDAVLVIVEKLSKPGLIKGGKATTRPFNVKVTRLGKNVRIAALDVYGRELTDVDLSFRIMMPKDRQSKKISGAYDLSKLTSVVLKALHREALNWILR